MSSRQENIKVEDEMGFIHTICVKYSPHLGFATAYEGWDIVAQCELGRIREPMSDGDLEWEQYEEKFAEWSDTMKHQLSLQCQEFF